MNVRAADDILTEAIRSGADVHIWTGTPAGGEVWLSGGLVIAAIAAGGERRASARIVWESEEEIAAAEARYAIAALLESGDPPSVDYAPVSESSLALKLDGDQLILQTREFLERVRDAATRVGADDVPMPVAAADASMSLTPDQQAVLDRVDGFVTVATIADDCGLPAPEAVLAVDVLVASGCLEIGSAMSAETLLAELEAAHDLASLGDTPIIEPMATIEEAAFEETPHPVQEIVQEGVDMASLMRELASISREDRR